jgi:hypothetical protein
MSPNFFMPVTAILLAPWVDRAWCDRRISR